MAYAMLLQTAYHLRVTKILKMTVCPIVDLTSQSAPH